MIQDDDNDKDEDDNDENDNGSQMLIVMRMEVVDEQLVRLLEIRVVVTIRLILASPPTFFNSFSSW
jgi:hypothetical protein